MGPVHFDDAFSPSTALHGVGGTGGWSRRRRLAPSAAPPRAGRGGGARGSAAAVGEVLDLRDSEAAAAVAVLPATGHPDRPAQVLIHAACLLEGHLVHVATEDEVSG